MATPELLRVPVPRVAVPSLKVIVPVGAFAPEPPVTVAVKVTLAPTITEGAEAVSVVALDPAVTVTATAVEAEDRLRESPP